VSGEQKSTESGGCWGCLGFVLLVALVIAAAMSVAALVDPFDWYPSLRELWADCSDDDDTARDECAYDHRFPGFWWHLVVNLGYAAVLLAALALFAGTVGALRRHRAARLSSAAAHATYERARVELALAAGAVAALGALPILVAAL
jgi:hypothetical protein